MYTYTQMIQDLGEIPYCNCKECQKNKIKVNVKPDKYGSYAKYKRKGYPKVIRGHHSPDMLEKNKLAHIGKHLSDETRKNMRNAQIAEKNHFFGKHHTLETRKKMSDNHADVTGKKNVNYGKPVHNDLKIFTHKTPLQGTILMHRWDRKYAQYLDSINTTYNYEPQHFSLILNGKETTYTPDFYIPKDNKYIEIKGWWRKDSKEKYELFLKEYTDIKIDLLFQKDLENLGIKLNITKEESQIIDNYKEKRKKFSIQKT